MSAVHTVTFERNTVTGEWRGFCAGCLWCHIGEQAEVQGLAAVHDLTWEPVEPTPPFWTEAQR